MVYGMCCDQSSYIVKANKSISEKLRNQSLVTIEIGPEKATFTVMRELLCFCSKYFRKAFESFDGTEAKTGKIVLEEVDESTFATFVHWLVVQKVELGNGKVVEHIDSAEELARLYIFADKYDTLDLRRTCIDLFMPFLEKEAGWFQHPLRHVVLRLAFENLLGTSGFHCMLADHEVLNIKFSSTSMTDLLWWLDFAPKALVARKMLHHTNIGIGPYISFSVCHYHEHGTEEERKQCPANSPKQRCK